MKRRIIGIALILIGIITLVYVGFTSVSADKVTDLNSMAIYQHIQWSPLIGMAMLIGGMVIIFHVKKKKGRQYFH